MLGHQNHQIAAEKCAAFRIKGGKRRQFLFGYQVEPFLVERSDCAILHEPVDGIFDLCVKNHAGGPSILFGGQPHARDPLT